MGRKISARKTSRRKASRKSAGNKSAGNKFSGNRSSGQTSRKPYRVGRSATGLGLFATAPIDKGAFIIAYRGRRISNAEAERLEARGSRYMYEINSRWTIDGSNRRNIARYANHSCRPNAESDVVKGNMILRAIKTIKPGDEITYDYGKEYFDIFLKPMGCKCVKCAEKRRMARKGRRAHRKRAQRRMAKGANGSARTAAW